ncbi:hypothetical protein PRIEUP_LOCUS18278 [Pristimantis euphronides]
MSGDFEDYTSIAHNASRYDCYFIVKEKLHEKLAVEMIAQGGKLLCVTLPNLTNLGMRFIDSLNFIPMKLSKLRQAMGVPGAKGHFPYFFQHG